MTTRKYKTKPRLTALEDSIAEALVPEWQIVQKWCPWCGDSTKGGFCSRLCWESYLEEE